MLRSIFCAAFVATLTVFAQAQFTANDVQYWIGEGDNEAVIVIDFLSADQASSFAWGYRFDGSATGGDALAAVSAADAQLTVNQDAFLNDILYTTFVGQGGMPNFWGTWSGTSTADWVANSGIGEALTDGAWFGCSYTDFNPAVAPAEPVAAYTPYHGTGAGLGRRR